MRRPFELDAVRAPDRLDILDEAYSRLPHSMDVTFEPFFEIDMSPLRRATSESESGLIDGRAIADALESQLAERADQILAAGVQPRLAFVQVGRDPASDVYVQNKREACRAIGIESDHVRLPEDVSESHVHGTLDELASDETCHGLLLQLPLPEHLDAHACLERIPPEKDVDGFHPHNLGLLMSDRARLEPCTPRGIMTLLRAAGVELEGRRAVVVGRSRIVGRPMAQMLIRANATVTVCHRHTRELADVVRDAELLVVATGVADLVKGDWLKSGTVVVDVGITRRDGELTGDVEFEAARERAELITPVPGGVGPMTVATLMENTIRAVCGQHGFTFVDGRLREDGSPGSSSSPPHRMRS